MSDAPLLDTHAWVWWIRRDERLGAAAIEQLDAFRSDERPYVADISLWEVAMLAQRGRLDLGVPLRTWLDVASHPRTVRIVPISVAVAVESAALPKTLSDPADRIIVATSRVTDLLLLTHDRAILRSRLASRWTIA
jgi:PIN domain nuclease of toxin-antitoxin system